MWKIKYICEVSLLLYCNEKNYYLSQVVDIIKKNTFSIYYIEKVRVMLMQTK